MSSPVKLINRSSVFHSVDAVLATLRKETNEEIRELLKIFQEEPVTNQTNSKHQPDDQNLLIVVEGLDGAGKTTLTKKLASNVEGAKISTPPKSILHLREFFDNQTPEVRRAYYALGNYIAAKEVKQLLLQSSVVMDRFWHSTTSYALAKEDDIPSSGDPVYRWPDDLLKPDIVFFFNVSEEIRKQRLSHRLTYTEEEDRLAGDAAFRQRLVSTYQRFVDPPITEVDANRYPNKIMKDLTASILTFREKKSATERKMEELESRDPD